MCNNQTLYIPLFSSFYQSIYLYLFLQILKTKKNIMYSQTKARVLQSERERMCKSNTLYSLIFFFLTIYLIFALYCYYIYIYCKAGERECVIYSNALYSFIFFCPSIYLFISLFIAI